jgi:Tol biopolymer transport system component
MLGGVRGALVQIAWILSSWVSVTAAASSPPASGAPSGELASCTLDRAIGTTIDPQPFLTKGFSLRWNAATNRLLYMEPNASGFYRVYTLRFDRSERQAVAEGRPELPLQHQGAAYWHPTGRYILMIAQKREWQGHRLFGIPDYEALPGFGRHDDLWLLATDDKRSWQLTRDPNTADQGILLPVFSPDGRRVAWSQRQTGGRYSLSVADFVDAPDPHLENVRSYQPGGGSYYEPGSFTSDSMSLTYAGDQDTHSFWRSQIYRLDLVSGQSTRLSQGNDYNEHPTVVGTPDGDWIVYMSTAGVDRYPGQLFLGTDWYAMRADGRDRKRLTTMNVNRRDNPENSGVMLVAGTVAISPAGDFMLGDVQDSLIRQTGLVKRVRFSCQ